MTTHSETLNKFMPELKSISTIIGLVVERLDTALSRSLEKPKRLVKVQYKTVDESDGPLPFWNEMMICCDDDVERAWTYVVNTALDRLPADEEVSAAAVADQLASADMSKVVGDDTTDLALNIASTMEGDMTGDMIVRGNRAEMFRLLTDKDTIKELIAAREMEAEEGSAEEGSDAESEGDAEDSKMGGTVVACHAEAALARQAAFRALPPRTPSPQKSCARNLGI